MNGNEAYINKYNIKIQNLLNQNKDKENLRGFYYYMQELSVSSIYNYLVIINNFLDHVKKKPEDLRLDDFTEYTTLHSQRTSSYRINIHAALSKFSTYLVAANLNPNNYMQYISRPKYKESIETVEKREKGFLSDEEIRQYWDNVQHKQCDTSWKKTWNRKLKARDMAIVLIFFNTGIRCSAMYKLDLSSIDFENKTLIVIDKEGKINKHTLFDETLDAISLWLEKREQYSTDEEALFVSVKGDRLSTMSIYHIIKEYGSCIEGKNITPHKLRATYGTMLYAATGDIYMVQECMEHSAPSTTQRYIRGQNEKNKKEAAEIMKHSIF